MHLRAQNKAQTVLAEQLSDTATALTVADSSKFPQPPFRCVIETEDGFEIVEVTNVDGTVWSVTRGVENTQPRSWPAGTNVELRWTAGMYEAIIAELEQLDSEIGAIQENQQSFDLQLQQLSGDVDTLEQETQTLEQDVINIRSNIQTLMADPDVTLSRVSFIGQVSAATTKWLGAAVVGAKIYCPPQQADTILVMDTSTNTLSHISLSTTVGSFSHAVAVNNKVYAVPDSATKVMVIDTVASTQTYIGDFTNDAGKWSFGVNVNGTVYCMPNQQSDVLVIDTSSDTTSLMTVSGATNPLGCGKAVLAPNGKIYALPYKSSQLLIVDPTVGTASQTSVTTTSYETYWSDAVLVNGKIYGVPFDARSILVVDTANDSFTTIGDLSQTQDKWYSGVAVGNKVFMFPYSGSNVLILDTTTNEITTLQLEKNETVALQAVLTSSDVIYAIPAYGTYILKLYANNLEVKYYTGLKPGWKWRAVVNTSNGIYGVPSDTTAALRIGPETKKFSAWLSTLLQSIEF